MRTTVSVRSVRAGARGRGAAKGSDGARVWRRRARAAHVAASAPSDERGGGGSSSGVDAAGDDGKKEGIDMKGLGQLVKMGMGAISGDITEINLDDPKRTVVMELEANNFEVSRPGREWSPTRGSRALP